MDRYMRESQEAEGDQRGLPASVAKIQIDEDAIWDDLSDDEQWQPLQEATRRLLITVKSPRSFRPSVLSTGDWNTLHFATVFELEHLHYLLMARQLSERIRDESWEEPLSSLLHGLDVAT